LPRQATSMLNNALLGLPEVFESNPQIRHEVGRAFSKGELRRVRSGIYTTNISDPIEQVVKRNLWNIVAMTSPGAVLTHRTALLAGPTPSGTVFLSGTYARVIDDIPGLKIRQIKGPGPLPGDSRFLKLHIASQARALIECLSGVPRGAETPYLAQEEVEAQLERILVSGEARLNQVRDSAREIAHALGAEESFRRLDSRIGALLGTRRTTLKSASAIGRTAERPYDARRLELFQALLEDQNVWPAVDRADPVTSGPPFANISFFDAYFSNFIEGTEFELDEAIGIVFENRIPSARPADAHDVLGTFQVVGNRAEMTRAPSSLHRDLFLQLLKSWHSAIMGGRPDKRPGQFKEIANRAGTTRFVEPGFVEGTLDLGFEMSKLIRTPFGRAAFLMFLIAEVHPFDDGNGRLARAVMNAELIASSQRRIIVPTVFRVEYIDALKKLSQEGQPRLFGRMLDAAQEFTHDVDFSTLDRAREDLNSWNALDTDPDSRLRRRPRGANSL